jgi:hypothetical protein
MTAEKPHAADQIFEKQSVVPGDKPPAGTPSHICFNVSITSAIAWFHWDFECKHVF